MDLFCCVVQKLEHSTEYFGRCCRNRLSLKQLKTFSWKLKMVYCKLKTYSWKIKMVYWKLKTIASELRSWSIANWRHTLENSRQYIDNWRQWKMNSHQLDPTSYHSWPLDASTGGWGTCELRSAGPNIVLLLATRCLYWGWGYIWKLQGVLQTEDILLKTKDGLLKIPYNRKWAQINQT